MLGQAGALDPTAASNYGSSGGQCKKSSYDALAGQKRLNVMMPVTTMRSADTPRSLDMPDEKSASNCTRSAVPSAMISAETDTSTEARMTFASFSHVKAPGSIVLGSSQDGCSADAVGRKPSRHAKEQLCR